MTTTPTGRQRHHPTPIAANLAPAQAGVFRARPLAAGLNLARIWAGVSPLTSPDEHGRPAEVRLSFRDWAGILAVAVTLLLAGAGSYLRHDRLLSAIATGQAHQGERLESLEHDIKRLEDIALRANGNPIR